MGERRAPSLRHALTLGLLHGPTELLPISSSAHTTLVPWLAGWPYGELDPELRKSFEVALHAGTAAALLLRPPWRATPSHPGGPKVAPSPTPSHRRVGFLAAAVIPPALTGYLLGGVIERHLGTPVTIAVGLLGGSAAMGLAEVRAQKRGVPRARVRQAFSRPQHTSLPTSQTHTHRPPRATPQRPYDTTTQRPSDTTQRPVECADSCGGLGLALGVAQSLALVPGVSRSGASLAAARACGFSWGDADRLSWRVGLPVIAGAALLKGTRLARARTPLPFRAPLAMGAASAFLSTLAASSTLSARRRERLLPACVAYRTALALLVVRRIRDNTG